MKNGIVIIALGYPLYGNCAFNLALSIKQTCKDIPIAVVYEAKTLSQLSKQELSYFDEFIELDESFYTVPGAKQPKQYQRAKLCVNLITNKLGWDYTIYMDADNIWFDRPVDWLFGQMCKRDFYIGYNGQYDARTKKKTNKNYTYWGADGVSEKTICNYHGITKILPQTISGFFYFRNGKYADAIFKKAREVYDDPRAPTLTWAGGKPDEYCLNIALGLADYTQEDAHIFQFNNVNGTMKIDMMKKKFWGMAVGGNQVAPNTIHLYNTMVNHLCILNGIETRHYHVDKKDEIKERQKF